VTVPKVDMVPGACAQEAGTSKRRDGQRSSGKCEGANTNHQPNDSVVRRGL